jgi:hypothetical protein
MFERIRSFKWISVSSLGNRALGRFSPSRLFLQSGKSSKNLSRAGRLPLASFTVHRPTVAAFLSGKANFAAVLIHGVIHRGKYLGGL